MFSTRQIFPIENLFQGSTQTEDINISLMHEGIEVFWICFHLIKVLLNSVLYVGAQHYF